MAAQPIALAPEEFHRQYDGAKPAYEFWFGAAVQKSVPNLLHGLVQMLIMMLLREQGGNTASEVRLKVAPEAEPVPDAIAVRGKFRGRYPVTAPELCIEILSPDDSVAKALKKASIYRGWGCEMVWIIDPVQRTAWTVSRDFNEPVWIAPDGALRTEGAAIELQKLFAEMGDSIEAANQ